MCLFKCTLLIQILLSFTNSPFALCIRSKIQPNMKKQNYQNVLIKPKSREVIVYTQGTFIEDENGKKVVYVSGGLYGESNILKHDYETMALIKKTSLDSKYFAEGIVKIGDKIYQQTWKEETFIEYNTDLTPTGKTIKMPSSMAEGWGLCEYKDNTILSTDGSSNIYFLDSTNLSSTRKTIEVIDNDKKKVKNLNEIRVIFENGSATNYALINIYLTPYIIKVDLLTGNVIETFDFTELINLELKENLLTSDQIKFNGYCLNGIAQVDKNNSKVFLLTGKQWKNYYQVQLN